MNMEKLSIEDPIAALATPWGESAIAVIRVSGAKSLELISKCFKGRSSLAQASGYSLHYGKFLEAGSDSEIDQVMAAVYRAPKSYTGEDSVEIFSHGSPAIINLILKALLKAGFRQAGPGEFTQRAFINGKIGLTQAEAVNEIIRARSDRGRALALNRLSGVIEDKINEIKGQLALLLASVEIQIDYPEDDFEGTGELDRAEDLRSGVELLLGELKQLLATYKTGKIIQEGVSVVIAGRTNAGKSTLFNLLLREDRAIVSDIHGTTRDYIEGLIAVEGIPIRLFDTAGLRKTSDPVELEGIRRTDKIVESAELVLFVIDSGDGVTEEEAEFIKRYEALTRVVKIWNKVDKNNNPSPEGFIPVSAQTGSGLDELNRRMVELLLGESAVDSSEPVIDSIRQKELLERCVASLEAFCGALNKGLSFDLLAVDLREALECLGEITGEVTTEEMLETMFSHFCVGK